jgi:hypothetical protein
VHYPFTVEDVEIALFLVTDEGHTLHSPNITVADIQAGVIRYRSIDYWTDEWKDVARESVSDALEVLALSSPKVAA